jgi:uncharacterized protein YoxC
MELALRDSITPGLKAIARELKALNEAAKDASRGTGDEIGRVTTATEKLGQASKAALRDVQELFGKVIEYGKAILGIGGAVESIKQLTEAFSDLASEQVKLSLLAEDMGIASESLEKFRAGAAHFAIDMPTATGYLTNFTRSLQELNTMRESSALFKGLALSGDEGIAFARRLLEIHDKGGDVGKQMEAYTEFLKTQKSEGAQRRLSDLVDVPPSALAGDL